MSPVTWSFTFADFGAASASVYVAGARLSTSHATFPTDGSETSRIQSQLALYFGVSATRIRSVSAFRTVDALTAFTFIIAPSNSSNDTRTATWLANRFARDMAALNTTYKPFANWTSLSPLMKSTVSGLLYCVATTWVYFILLQVRVSVTSPVIQARANSTFQSSASVCMSLMTISGLSWRLISNDL